MLAMLVLCVLRVALLAPRVVTQNAGEAAYQRGLLRDRQQYQQTIQQDQTPRLHSFRM
jgi:hypothetical protein